VKGKLIAGTIGFFALFAVYQTVTGNGSGTVGGQEGRVRGLFSGKSECIDLGDGWAPTSCGQPVAGTPRALPDDAPLPVTSTCGVAGTDAILATIRTQESGGRYAIGPNAGGASGAYQFIQRTWNATARNAGRSELVGRGPWTASPADQDALARQLVSEALAGTDDISRIPVVWYVGSTPPPRGWDVVPYPSAGNTLTPRQYQRKWLALHAQAGKPCN
jgi:hypothetical protein